MGTVVIGRGIIGLASAYYLAQAGESVTLLERDALGTGSTGRAAGGIRRQFTTPVNVRLSERSRRGAQRGLLVSTSARSTRLRS